MLYIHINSTDYMIKFYCIFVFFYKSIFLHSVLGIYFYILSDYTFILRLDFLFHGRKHKISISIQMKELFSVSYQCILGVHRLLFSYLSQVTYEWSIEKNDFNLP